MIKVGDRVECVKENRYADTEEEGVVIDIGNSCMPYLIEWDNYVGGHNGNGKGKDGYCEWVAEGNIKVIEKTVALDIGSRVECIENFQFAKVGEKGTILSNFFDKKYKEPYLIEWDNNVGGHDGEGKGKRGHCEWIGSFYIKPIEEEDKMQDLKVGQVVETRNGKMWFVLDDRLISKDSWINRKSYDKTKCKDENFYDIVKIFNAPIEKDMISWSFSSISNDGLELVWEEKIFTKDDITIAKLIPKEWKYIARDEDRDLCVYIEKPRKHFETWEGVNVWDMTLFNKYFKNIS